MRATALPEVLDFSSIASLLEASDFSSMQVFPYGWRKAELTRPMRRIFHRLGESWKLFAYDEGCSYFDATPYAGKSGLTRQELAE